MSGGGEVLRHRTKKKPSGFGGSWLFASNERAGSVGNFAALRIIGCGIVIGYGGKGNDTQRSRGDARLRRRAHGDEGGAWARIRSSNRFGRSLMIFGTRPSAPSNLRALHRGRAVRRYLAHGKIQHTMRYTGAVAVADITRSLRSSRSPCCTSRASANPRSASSERSWNSSNSTARDAFENGIVEDHAREHALGDDLDAGPARHFRDRSARDSRPSRRPVRRASSRDAHSSGARREPARLEREELHVLRPGLPGEHQRHTRGLAGARRGDQRGQVMGRERRRELRQHIVNSCRMDPAASQI